MKIKRSLLLAPALAFSFAQGACAQVRLADGEPCRANEKTYYDTDGATAFACQLQGGPAYGFKVFVDNQVAWEGVLEANRSETTKLLIGLEGAPKILEDSLVVGRCFHEDPSGETVFFGRRHVSAIQTFTMDPASQGLPAGEGSKISIPEVTLTGHCIKAAGKDREEPLSLIDSTGSSKAYRVVLRAL